MGLLLLHAAAAAKALTIDERDLVIGNVYRKLMEIESRLLPCGLHVVGVPPTAEEAVATLVNIAEIDRPDQVRLEGKEMGGLLDCFGRHCSDTHARTFVLLTGVIVSLIIIDVLLMSFVSACASGAMAAEA